MSLFVTLNVANITDSNAEDLICDAIIVTAVVLPRGIVLPLPLNYIQIPHLLSRTPSSFMEEARRES